MIGAFDAEQLVGMTGFYRDALLKRRHVGHVWGVFVSPAARGKGVGREMLVEVIESARALPEIRCVRLMVAVTQEAARHLYKELGFRMFGTEPWSLKIGEQYVDEIHMTLEFGLAGLVERGQDERVLFDCDESDSKGIREV